MEHGHIYHVRVNRGGIIKDGIGRFNATRNALKSLKRSGAWLGLDSLVAVVAEYPSLAAYQKAAAIEHPIPIDPKQSKRAVRRGVSFSAAAWIPGTQAWRERKAKSLPDWKERQVKRRNLRRSRRREGMPV